MYSGYIERQRELDESFAQEMEMEIEEEDDFPKPSPTKRAKRRTILEYQDENGIRKALPPTMTPWWLMYVETDARNESKRWAKIFRRRFRLPHDQYKEMVEKVKNLPDYFGRWLKSTSSPIELLVLGVFRYLGRGLTFDDLEEYTGISEEVHRCFFHVFIKFGSTKLFKEYVIPPNDSNHGAAQHQHEYNIAGCHGAIGSTDAVHIMSERISYKLRNQHIGFKMSHTARTYNVTVNHRRRILCTTDGHPATWNDKTLVLFDEFVRGIHDGKILENLEFELFELNEKGEAVAAKYQGCWLLVDNGYLNWSTTIPPMKISFDRRECRWAEWIESMRKDVECTFGILKGRWRILKAGIRVHGALAADAIWKTCCALHNWLLEVDGLDAEWERGVLSVWEGELGQFDPTDWATQQSFALRRLQSETSIRNYDVSRMGTSDNLGDDLAPPCQGTEPATDDKSIRVVRKLHRDYFRRKLVEHFDILWRQNKIQWPKRHGCPCPKQSLRQEL
jgi:hypothetical protein